MKSHAESFMPQKRPFPLTLEAARTIIGRDATAAWINFYLEELAPQRVLASMAVDKKHIAPNGFLHAAVVTAFADITSGLGTSLHLPSPGHIFATLEIKTNFMGSAHSGTLLCEAVPRHAGSATQVWDATVSSKETGKVTALFRCTQMILEDRRPGQAHAV